MSWHAQVPSDTALADALCVVVAWLAALPSPLLPAQAARGAESVTSLPGAEALLADSASPASWAIFRHLLGLRTLSSSHRHHQQRLCHALRHAGHALQAGTS